MANKSATSIKPQIEFPWHSYPVSDCLEQLNSSENGLDLATAENRLQEYGENRLKKTKPVSPLIRFLQQFHNLLIYVLLVAAAVTMMLQHWIDSGVIMAVVIANALIGFIQEGKAEDALQAIRDMLSPQAQVIRDGQRMTIAAEHLVPGDIVHLQAGDKVPADLRLVQIKDLKIQEAALTGESVPTEKSEQQVAEDVVLGDRNSMAYSGTLVTYGQGNGLVVATGNSTELGRISDLVAGVEKLTTPLMRQMHQFSSWLTAAILGIALLTFIFGLIIRDYTMIEMFLATVGLAVAAIPEGLPAIITITLAIGVQRMARRKAIIRHLPAVETLGAVKVVCSDKTGTLTKNEMTVTTIQTTDSLFEITGTGYEPHGSFLLNGIEVELQQHQHLGEIVKGAVLCNDACMDASTNEIIGDPMEGALLVVAHKGIMDPKLEAHKLPRKDLIPFDSKHKFMATLHHDHQGQALIYMKGAPECLLERCSKERLQDKDIAIDTAKWQDKIETMCSQGQRVLAVATKTVDDQQSDLKMDDVEADMVLLGLFGLIDPPREEVIDSVAQCQSSSIQVKMITGDHALTACAIAKQLNLENYDNVLTGKELDGMSDEELYEQVMDVDVFARVTPEHKLRLVSELQRHGLIVSMTGDGVNDAPALKRADVGVAMGDKGTEVAKDSSEMVLVDDNFATIIAAIQEGRTVYDNLKKSILFILPTNGGEALSILAAVLLGFPHLPLTAVQILWVNMITAVTLALSLAFEPSEANVMQRAPRNPKQAILTPLFLWRISFVSIILVIGTFGLFVYYSQSGYSIEYARTVAVNTLVMFEIFYLFNSRYIINSVMSYEGFFGNKYVVLAICLLIVFQMIFTYVPAFQFLFATTAISLSTWMVIILIASSVLFLVEIEKVIIRKKFPKIAI